MDDLDCTKELNSAVVCLFVGDYERNQTAEDDMDI